ncbi:MAG: haloacid dehalogenase-like hydrolase, partial [Terrimicrobiaceae bacterium]
MTQAPPPVLCVDLDGTLIRGDASVKSFVSFLTRNPLRVFPALVWLRRGRVHLKREIARRIPLDPAAFSYREDVLAFLKEEKARGRTLILATASDQIYADAIANHLGIFSEVLGSDGVINLSAHRKRAALKARFGVFSYMGNSRDDLAVWRGAEEAIAVATPPSVL